MLNFPNSWRFEAPGEALAGGAVYEFRELISRISTQGDRWWVMEFFKERFAGAASRLSLSSSSLSWAESDLTDLMYAAAQNPVLFIEAFYEACSALNQKYPDWGLPSIDKINRILADCDTGFELKPPDLFFTSLRIPVIKPERQPSLDEQAQQLIKQSLDQSESLLKEGRHRQAVAEILWLLETVSTAFRGLNAGSGTIHQDYFNRIAKELRRQHKGMPLDQVLGWITMLHHFLSSTGGGGVRHGADIASAAEMQKGDAELYCNLIRSYIGFLMAEHDRMTRMQSQSA